MKSPSIALPRGKFHATPQTIVLYIATILLLSIFPIYYYPPLLQAIHYASRPILLPSNCSGSPSRPLSPPPPSSSPPILSDTLVEQIQSARSLTPSPPPPSPPPNPPRKRERGKTRIMPLDGTCDMTKGDWVEDPEAPYYTNDTCRMIQEHQNCMKYGRPDTGYLRWRWQPDGCDLRRFEPTAFLEVVRGKKMAFVGDSLARNHMQSLMCLLSKVEYPKDISLTSDENFKRMYYKTYDFTIWIFWSPFLVKAEDPPEEGPYGLWKIHLDQVDHTWTNHLKKFDYLLISAGNWYTRPSMYYQKRKLIGCNYCQTSKKVKRLTVTYANKKSFQTAFRAILKFNGYRGVTFLRTFSPSHFENGRWNEGGDCKRIRPFRPNEIRISHEESKFYKDQVEEFVEAQEMARRRGLKFRLLDVTQAMLLRADGHPSRYGHRPQANLTLYNDCVHWCLPGPVDMWNDLLFQMIVA